MLTLRYIGTNYCGYQVQPNGTTVASVLQDAIEGLFGERLPVVGCSRTDAGVHAEMFCAHFCTESSIPCERIIPALNVRLPRDVAVTSCREVPSDFHARYSCLGKQYDYKILNARIRDPFWEKRALLCPTPLDSEKMDRAAQMFIGKHDFTAFCSTGGSVEDKTRTVSLAQVRRDGDLVTFSVAANGFLYNMVRIMVGTLLDAAAGKIQPEDIPEILSSGDRSRAGQTAPAHGLYLVKVCYPDFNLTGGE